MSIWRFGAAVDGYIAAHVPEEAGAMSASEADDVWAWMMAKEGRVQ
jgi:hypothetical protein